MDKTVAVLQRQNQRAGRQAGGQAGEHASKTMHHHSSYHSLDDAQFRRRWGKADAGLSRTIQILGRNTTLWLLSVLVVRAVRLPFYAVTKHLALCEAVVYLSLATI